MKMTTKELLSYLKPEAGRCAATFVCSLLSVAGTLLIPILVGLAVGVIENTAAIGLNWSSLGNYLIGISVCVAVATLFSYLQALLSGIISFRITAAIRTDCMTKILTCPLAIIDSIPHGDLIARVGVDTDAVGDGLLQGITNLFTGIITIIGTIGFMIWVDVYTALVVICLTPITLVVSWLIARRSHKIFVKQSALRGEMGALVAETFGSQKLIKAFGQEEETEKRFEKINRQVDRIGAQAQFTAAMVNPSTRVVNYIIYTAVAVYGALSIINGISAMTVGALTSFLLYANQYTRPFNDISTVAAELQSATASAKRIFHITRLPSETNGGSAELTDVHGDVALDNVTFGYTSDVTLMRNLSIDVRQGMRVAIVGPTGCGKSTLINLLMRFYDVSGGKITVDGTPITDVSLKSLRTSYGMVLQETWLANATVAQNIAYGRPEASHDEVIAAAKAAHCHRFISSLPQGYDTPVSDDANLSAGQKQLLCIARVMLMSPPMLILDEATSNIDTRTEQRIQRAFATLTADKTSFVVAHRFATIMDADLILVMRDGNIVEQGTHAALMNEKGFYFDLYNAQFR